jgi:hypothetical protein
VNRGGLSRCGGRGFLEEFRFRRLRLRRGSFDGRRVRMFRKRCQPGGDPDFLVRSRRRRSGFVCGRWRSRELGFGKFGIGNRSGLGRLLSDFENLDRRIGCAGFGLLRSGRQRGLRRRGRFGEMHGTELRLEAGGFEFELLAGGRRRRSRCRALWFGRSCGSGTGRRCRYGEERFDLLRVVVGRRSRNGGWGLFRSRRILRRGGHHW